jgi:hypothetical protein
MKYSQKVGTASAFAVQQGGLLLVGVDVSKAKYNNYTTQCHFVKNEDVLEWVTYLIMDAPKVFRKFSPMLLPSLWSKVLNESYFIRYLKVSAAGPWYNNEAFAKLSLFVISTEGRNPNGLESVRFLVALLLEMTKFKGLIT